MATEAQQFIEDHGYVRGSQEAKLIGMGYNLADVRKQVGSWGNNLNPGELAEILPKLGPSPIQQQGINIRQGLQDLTSQKFQFDTEGAIKSAQQEASSIFSPQAAQLEAIRQLQSSQAEEQRLQTEEQFDKQLQQEIEMINNRGAYFGGGAIQREQDIMDLEARTLRQLDLQANAANFSNLAQQAQLSAQEALYVKDRVFNDRASAYNVFLQERGFQFDVLQTQYQQYQDERNFARSVFESDRAFNEDVRQFQAQYNLSMEQFELSKDRFQEDVRQYNETVAWEKFKYNNRSIGSEEEDWSTPEVRQWASEKVDEGYNWHEINELAKEEGIFTFGGSDLDNQLWREFEGQENPLYDGRVGEEDDFDFLDED
jgi:hypothetical protein